jgi:hypothetical protein
MSYFMVTAGPSIDMRGLEPLELIPITEAQDYVRNLESQLSKLDGTPLFMVHDGCSWCSDDLVYAAVGHEDSHSAITFATFSELISRLVAAGHTFRIWWADNTPDACLRVDNCTSPTELFQRIQQLESGPEGGRVGLRLQCSQQ